MRRDVGRVVGEEGRQICFGHLPLLGGVSGGDELALTGANMFSAVFRPRAVKSSLAS